MHSAHVFIHAASRTPSYGFKTSHGYSAEELARSLPELLSLPANDILRRLPVPVDAVFVSNQFLDVGDAYDKSTEGTRARGGEVELLVNQLVDQLRWPHHSEELRLAGVTALRIETATNGLTALKAASDYLRAGGGTTALVVGGEKLTPRRFSDGQFFNQHFADWVEGIVGRIASALAPDDRKHCRSMPAAATMVLHAYCRTHRVDVAELRGLVERLTRHQLELASANPCSFQRYRQYLGMSEPEFTRFASRGSEFKGDPGERMSRERVAAFYGVRSENLRISETLSKLDASPLNDGAGALLLSRERVLQTLSGDRESVSDVRLTGCAVSQDTLSLTERKSLDSFFATRHAARRAYTEAALDVTRWRRDLAPLLVENHDAFAPLSLLNLQDLYLFHSHKDVVEFLEQEHLQGNSEQLMLNPSGGLLEGHPFSGTALIKTAESFARLTHRPDAVCWHTNAIEASGPKPGTAIVHSFGGIGSSAGVAVLDATKPDSAELCRQPSARLPYLSLGARLEPVRARPARLRGGRIVAASRLSMPFLARRPPERFQLEAGKDADNRPAGFVLALVEDDDGHRAYAYARKGSDEAEVLANHIVDRDLDVELLYGKHEDGLPAFRLRRDDALTARSERAWFALRSVLLRGRRALQKTDGGLSVRLAALVTRPAGEMFDEDLYRAGLVQFAGPASGGADGESDPVSGRSMGWREVADAVADANDPRRSTLLVLPALSVPGDQMGALSKLCKKHGVSLLAGLEHQLTALHSPRGLDDLVRGAVRTANRSVFISGNDNMPPRLLDKNAPNAASGLREPISRQSEPVCWLIRIEFGRDSELRMLGLFADDLLAADIAALRRQVAHERLDLLAVLGATDDFPAVHERLARLLSRSTAPPHVVFANHGRAGGSFLWSPRRGRAAEQSRLRAEFENEALGPRDPGPRVKELPMRPQPPTGR